MPGRQEGSEWAVAAAQVPAGARGLALGSSWQRDRTRLWLVPGSKAPTEAGQGPCPEPGGKAQSGQDLGERVCPHIPQVPHSRVALMGEDGRLGNMSFAGK